MAYIKSLKGQQWLLPPSIEDLIPGDHVCFLVEGFMDSLDYSGFDLKYGGVGAPAYHPRILLKLLVMGVLDRVRSSRRLSRNARENLTYMYLAEKLAPDFRTISDFRKNNPDIVKEAFKHTVTLARQEGMLDLSHLSTDGSKVKANAANKRVITKDEIEFLMKFVDDELEEWARQDDLEDGTFGRLRGSDELPGKSRRKIQRTVKHYVKKFKERGGVFKQELTEKLQKACKEVVEHDRDKVSLTDPESRFMKNKKSRIELSYNIQATVDKNGFIVAADVCQDITDVRQLQPQVNQTRENIELPPGVKWCFDNGYFEGGNLRFLNDEEIDGYIPGQEKKTDNPYDKKHFKYDPNRDEYICPRNQPATFLREVYDKQKNKPYRIYEAQGCASCKNRVKCTKTKTGIRQIKRYPYETERYAMTEKMKTSTAKETYKIRAQTIEPVIGDIKENKDVKTFLTRGLETVRTEYKLACMAINLRKMWCNQQEKDTRKHNPLNQEIRHPLIKTVRLIIHTT